MTIRNALDSADFMLVFLITMPRKAFDGYAETAAQLASSQLDPGVYCVVASEAFV